MDRLENVVQPYAWGSRTAIAALRGAAPSAAPEAELWMGAHPSAPSRVGSLTLLDLITEDPERQLGSGCVEAFGPRLPFLLKVLAADEPLSLQAHPSIQQAEAGYDREDAAGVPRNATHRNYRDRNHKPELLCALGPFDALCGFRDPGQTRAFFDALGVSGLKALIAHPLDETFRTLMRMDARALVAETAAACARYSGTFSREAAWGVRLAERHQGDPGVIGALLLNLVHLDEGEAIYLPAGNLHAYLGGVGVEIMANSDNVLRGGLTPKHVDVDELLSVLDFRAGPVERVAPVRRSALDVWETPAREFELARAIVTGSEGTLEVPVRAATIVLCTRGSVLATDDDGSATLASGDSAFVRGSTTRLTLHGNGTVFLATAVVAPLL